MSFTGFDPEAFRFLFEIGFNNNTEWFELNRNRYKKFVQQPMRQLAAELMPTALDIDPNFNTSLNATVSRIRRDTRFTRDKSPYRNHVWIGYRYPKTRISEGCTLWFEITPQGYDYGAGFYSADSAMMERYRKRLTSDPAGFLALAEELEAAGFTYAADAYKKQHFPDAPERIRPYINVRSFAWEKSVSGVADLIAPSGILDRLRSEFTLLAPMYRYINSIANEVSSELTEE